MLVAYNVEITAEFRLAAKIVVFSFDVLEALGQATAPDISLNRVLRVRSGSMGLSRESAQAERRLGQIQKVANRPHKRPYPKSSRNPH